MDDVVWCLFVAFHSNYGNPTGEAEGKRMGGGGGGEGVFPLEEGLGDLGVRFIDSRPVQIMGHAYRSSEDQLPVQVHT